LSILFRVRIRVTVKHMVTSRLINVGLVVAGGGSLREYVPDPSPPSAAASAAVAAVAGSCGVLIAQGACVVGGKLLCTLHVSAKYTVTNRSRKTTHRLPRRLTLIHYNVSCRIQLVATLIHNTNKFKIF